MIAYDKGILTYESPDTVWVETEGGVAYEIYVPSSIFNYLPPLNEEVKLYTYLNVKEDLMQLYGFIDKDELDMFKLLITVNGIGPKGALSILSFISPDDIRFAILAGDSKTISKAPGIGAKTASRVILDLKDKVDLEDTFESSLGKKNATASAGFNDIKRDAIEALTALGYNGTEAMKSINKITITEDMTAEDLIKAALKEI